MAFRFRRRSRNGRDDAGLVGDDGKPAVKVLHAACDRQGDGERFRLEPCVEDLFDESPTQDVQTLKGLGYDAHRFYTEELAPNWEDLGRGARGAKVEAFASLASALKEMGDDGSEIGPVVRTKLLVLAWAHDEAYGEERYLARLEREPAAFSTA